MNRKAIKISDYYLVFFSDFLIFCKLTHKNHRINDLIKTRKMNATPVTLTFWCTSSFNAKSWNHDLAFKAANEVIFQRWMSVSWSEMKKMSKLKWISGEDFFGNRLFIVFPRAHTWTCMYSFRLLLWKICDKMGFLENS